MMRASFIFLFILLSAISFFAPPAQAANVVSGNDPLERDILRWMRYQEGAPGSRFEDIAAFMSSHPDWPGLNRLRAEAEKAMPEGYAPQKVIDWFQENQPVTPGGMDIYVKALMRVGRSGEARDILRSWWKGASMTRDQQKTFFRAYGAYFDRASHLERLNMLLYRGEYSNARAIAAVLGKGYPALSEARIALAEGRGDVNAVLDAVPSNLRNDEGLLYERLRRRRRHDLDEGAIEILKKAPGAGQMYQPDAWWAERHILVRRLIEKKQYKRAYDLARSHRQKEGFPFAQAEWVSGWLALEFVNKPWKAFEHFERLYNNVETPISKARGAYWAGRASAALGHPEIARKWYEQAAAHPTVFYGQLARSEIGARPSLPTLVSVQAPGENFKHQDMVRAARWLTKAGLRSEAASFLLKMGKLSQNQSDYAYAAKLAADLGQPHIAIKIAQDAQKNGFYLPREAYPSVTSHLRKVGNVEWALVHALIRQESRFDERAASPAGALGLMQLMPATAKEVARKSGAAHQTGWLTSRPSHNINLGTGYLGQMLDRFDGNYALAVAAYNAGPNRVARWIETFGDPRKGDISMIEWIERIPVYETRNYVQRVLEGVYVYRLHLKNIQKEPRAPIHIAMQ